MYFSWRKSEKKQLASYKIKLRDTCLQIVGLCLQAPQLSKYQQNDNYYRYILPSMNTYEYWIPSKTPFEGLKLLPANISLYYLVHINGYHLSIYLITYIFIFEFLISYVDIFLL